VAFQFGRGLGLDGGAVDQQRKESHRMAQPHGTSWEVVSGAKPWRRVFSVIIRASRNCNMQSHRL
jgi:hypothetical protein